MRAARRARARRQRRDRAHEVRVDRPSRPRCRAWHRLVEVWGLSLGDDSFAHDPELYSPSGDVRASGGSRTRLLRSAAPRAGAGHRSTTTSRRASPGRVPAPVPAPDGRPGCDRGRRAHGRLGARMVAGPGRGPERVRAAPPGPRLRRGHVRPDGPVHARRCSTRSPSPGSCPSRSIPSTRTARWRSRCRVRTPLRRLRRVASSPGRCPTAVAGRGLAGELLAPRRRRVGRQRRARPRERVARRRQPVRRRARGRRACDPTGESFLAGMLEHLPALTRGRRADARSPTSGCSPSHWAGAYACWGNENREAALRLEGAGGASASRLARTSSGSRSTARRTRTSRSARSSPPGSTASRTGSSSRAPVQRRSGRDDSRRAARGRMVRLPETLAEAAESSPHPRCCATAMGPYLHDRVVAVRRAEARGRGRARRGGARRPPTAGGTEHGRSTCPHAPVVDAHCHPWRNGELLVQDPLGFEDRITMMGMCLISSGLSTRADGAPAACSPNRRRSR